MKEAASAVELFAETEDLIGHARSMKVRRGEEA